ncbi:MAG: M20/M25/M40 family metallo-hydrolase [Candidatus Obscuribacterales bacterium]|nr:M20/M25/M40 family metallo-hydrolase [Candidatus Obscuribacterales bacterium]
MEPVVEAASHSIEADSLLNHIKVLASDEFAGRLPGSVGEERTVDYLKKQCELFGLSPGNGRGGFFQKVPVYGLKAQPELAFAGGDKELKLSFPDDFVAMSRNLKGSTAIANSEVVFVGHGIIAPEYGWDDYKGLDVRGKTLVMLIGDPSRPNPKDPSKSDDSFFRGKALTYYGRWTYKYEIASKLGAAAVLIVHETEPAGYGYDVVTASWGQENFDLGTNTERVKVEGWLSSASARKLFNMGGISFDEVKRKAQLNDFSPVTFGAKMNANVKSTVRKFETSNVVAMLPGSDPELKKECLVYSAHWDHFGTKQNKDGSVGIFRGALDNGSGVATILEIARAYSKLEHRPKRSVYFLFTTLEERGLLGSLHYVESPPVPLEKTLAVINVDVMNLWGRTKEVVSIAKGHSTLDNVLLKYAALQERSVISDPEPEKGYFYRSDHLEFIRRGVPAMFFLHPGASYIGKPADYGTKKRLAYVRDDYHKVTDEVKSDWDLSGTVEDAQLLFQAGFDVANGEEMPQWSATSEFKRESSKSSN